MKVFCVDVEPNTGLDIEVFLNHGGVMDDTITTVKRGKRSFSDAQKKARSQFLDDFGAILRCSTEQIRKMSKQMLQDWAIVLGLPTSGNKAELTHLICEWCSEHRYDAQKLAGSNLTMKPLIEGWLVGSKSLDFVPTGKGNKVAFNYLFNSGMIEQLGRAVVCSISRSHGYVAGKEACIQLRNKGFHEEIWQDIVQELSAETWGIICGGCLELRSGIPEFTNGAFGRLFGAVYRTLSSYKWADSSKALPSFVSFWTKDEDGNETWNEEIIKVTSRNAVSTLSQVASLESFEGLSWMQDYKKFLKASLSESMFEKVWAVVMLRAQGMTQEQISSYTGQSWNTVHRLVLRAQTLATAFDKDMTVARSNDSKEYGCVSGPACYEHGHCYQWTGTMTTCYEDENKVSLIPVEKTVDAKTGSSMKIENETALSRDSVMWETSAYKGQVKATVHRIPCTNGDILVMVDGVHTLTIKADGRKIKMH